MCNDSPVFSLFQPSSSGRAADLLARESGVVPGFVGFGVSTSNDPGYVPAVQGVEEIDNLVDADFRMVLRKLSKRDAVTKLKVSFVVIDWSTVSQSSVTKKYCLEDKCLIIV